LTSNSTAWLHGDSPLRRSATRRRARHGRALVVPNAADYELFSRAVRTGLWSELPRPAVGFFGAFAEWLDRDWIAQAARRFPGWSLCISAARDLRARHREYSRAASAEFDVCIMPFRDPPITRSMNAVKIYEYLAAGKPVVAPDLPETRPLADACLIEVYGECSGQYMGGPGGETDRV